MNKIEQLNYKQLLKKSTIGSKDATERLFAIGDECLSTQQLSKASTAFKDAAISYRIMAFRKEAIIEDYQKEVGILERNISVFRLWIETFSNGYPILIKCSSKITKSDVEDAIYGNCKYPSDPNILEAYKFLESALEKSCDRFAKINGNRPLFIKELILDYFGIKNESKFDIKTANIDTLVGINILGLKIERMCFER